jgi:hypothetical protein
VPDRPDGSAAAEPLARDGAVPGPSDWDGVLPAHEAGPDRPDGEVAGPAPESAGTAAPDRDLTVAGQGRDREVTGDAAG